MTTQTIELDTESHDHDRTIPAGCFGCCDAALEDDEPGYLTGHSSCYVGQDAIAAYRAGYAPSYENGEWTITVPPDWQPA